MSVESSLREQSKSSVSCRNGAQKYEKILEYASRLVSFLYAICVNENKYVSLQVYFAIKTNQYYNNEKNVFLFGRRVVCYQSYGSEHAIADRFGCQGRSFG
jgi:hypothetical protein